MNILEDPNYHKALRFFELLDVLMEGHQKQLKTLFHHYRDCTESIERVASAITSDAEMLALAKTIRDADYSLDDGDRERSLSMLATNQQINFDHTKAE